MFEPVRKRAVATEAVAIGALLVIVIGFVSLLFGRVFLHIGAGLPASKTPTPIKPSFGPIDAVVEGMATANVAFNAPSKMKLNERHKVRLLLSLERSIDELILELAMRDEKEGKAIRVTSKFEAILKSSGFDVVALTPGIQAITQVETTEWAWEITSKSGGRQSLHLTLIAKLDIDNSSYERTIQVFERQIEVEVDWEEEIKLFVVSNWKWVLTVLVIPSGALFYRKYKSPKDRQRIGFKQDL